MIVLEADNICVEYFIKRNQTSLLAIQDASFTVKAGQFVAIVGPSGCGKSTLLTVIAGLLPINRGHILLNGSAITGPGCDRALVFQSPALMPWRTALQNVTYGLELQGYQRKQVCQQAEKILHLVGLQGFERSFPHELSGGMQQRVNLARALAIEPSLLLLDEPLASLDAQTREYMQSELQRIWQATGNTAIYVTHQIDEAIYLADQVIVMSTRPGRIKAVIPVIFPRPRPLSIKQQPQFNQLEQQVWRVLQAEPLSSDVIST